MTTSTTWRIQGISTGGRPLVLSQVVPWGEGGAVVPTAVTSNATPTSGSVTNLIIADNTECVFSANDIYQPGFYIEFTFDTAVALWGFRFAGPNKEHWPLRHSIRRGRASASVNRVQWVAGVLSPAPSAPPNFVTAAGTWTEQTDLGSKNWRSASVSSDGQTMLVGASSDHLQLTKDGGATWSEVPAVGSGDWVSTAASGDGQTLLAGAYGGVLWVSRDGGSTWEAQTPLGLAGWACAAASSDGAVLMCGIFGGAFWLTKDGGATWVSQTTLGDGSWRSASVSSDGQTILVGGTGRPQLSKDGGATWSAVMTVGSGDWTVTAVSGDGQVMLAGAYGGSLWLSKDAGLSWVSQDSFGNNSNWWRGTCSSDGRTLLCSVFGGGVYLSKDGGVAWVKQEVLPTAEWRAAALSSNGLTMLAGAPAATVRLRIDADPTYLQNDPTSARVAAVAVLSTEPAPVQGGPNTYLQQAVDVLDTEFGGAHKVYGTVARKNTPTNVPLRRRVRLHRSRDGMLVRETWSRADGSYEFLHIAGHYDYDVIAWDYEMSYRSVVANNLTPEAM